MGGRFWGRRGFGLASGPGGDDDAEHAADALEEAGGLGAGGEEFGVVRQIELKLQLAGDGGGFIGQGANEPEFAARAQGGEAWDWVGCAVAGLGRAGCIRVERGAGAGRRAGGEAGHEAFEAAPGAGEIAAEGVGVRGHGGHAEAGGDEGAQPGQDLRHDHRQGGGERAQFGCGCGRVHGL